MSRKNKAAAAVQPPEGDPTDAVNAVVLLDCRVNGVPLKLGQVVTAPRALVAQCAAMLDPHPNALAAAQGAIIVDLMPAPAAEGQNPQE